MRSPLSVRINDGRTDRMVGLYATGLRFTKTAPGGHHSASMYIKRPRSMFPNLGPADIIDISDGRTGRVLWSGYTDNPGYEDGTSGQGLDLSAMGGVTRASDQSERLIYIDCSYEQWRRDDMLGQTPSATGRVDIFPSDAGTRAGDPCAFVQFAPGVPITSGNQTGVVYDAFDGSSMTLGGFAGFYDAGQTDANYTVQWVTGPSPATAINGVSMSGVGGSFELYETDDFAAGYTNIIFRLIRAAGGATTVATDNVWAGFGEVVMLGHLVDRTGVLRDMSAINHVVTGPTSGYVLAHEVAEDLLGRLLTFCDPTTATIDTATAEINQLAYHDGATAAQVFEDLALHEPDFYWGIGERLLNGSHRFWYRAWPTTARYEISAKDGYQAPGSDVDLCNRIAVYWTDSKGVKQVTVRTSTVAALDDAGRTKDAESITIPDGQGSLEAAERIGDAVLAEKADPPKAATAVVKRPLLDSLTGNMVMPWEIEPGHLVRVRETGDLLRLTEMEYVDDDCSATLTLGEPQLSIEQRVARLTKVRAA